MAWKTETSYCEKQIIAPECLESKLFEKKGLIMHYESQVEEKKCVVLFSLKLTVVQQEQKLFGEVRLAPKPSVRCTDFY